MGGKGFTETASSGLGIATERQMAGSGLQNVGTSSTLRVGSLPSGYPTYGESSTFGARDPYYQPPRTSGLGYGTGNSKPSDTGAKTVDLLQKCKYKIITRLDLTRKR